MGEPLFPRTLAATTGIPFLGGRPRRSDRVGDEDLTNLRIALGLHHDVLDLCADPHLFESEPVLAGKRTTSR